MHKRINIKPKYLLIALPLALIGANTIFTNYIQNNYPFLSFRNLALTAVVLVGLTILFYLGTRYFFESSRIDRTIERGGIFRILAAAILLTIYLVGLLNTNKTSNIHKNPFFFPVNRIEITAVGERDPLSSGYGVELIKFSNALGHTSFSQFEVEGDWSRTGDDTLVLESADHSGSILWEGRTAEIAYITFRTGPAAGIVRVQINNAPAEELNLYTAEYDTLALSYPFTHGWLDRVSAVLFQLTFGFIVIYLLIHYLSTWTWLRQISSPHKRAWLLYALPMILVWGFCLLILHPGLVGSDSLDHYRQAWSGVYDDWHSVLYTLLIAATSAVTRSPAIMAVLQVLALSLTAAVGLRFYDTIGTRRWVPWLISWVMALSLPLAFNVITVWKDIPYSISIFGLTLMCLWVIRTNGSWLDNPVHWVVLGLVSALIILFRQNGLLVPVFTFAALLLHYRTQWKRILLSGAITAGIILTFTGPVYRMLKVDTDTYKVNAIVLHHLGAHVYVGTPLTPEARAFLLNVAPKNEWEKYDCTLVNSLWFNTQLDRAYLNQNSDEALRLMMQLFFTNPRVDIDHMLCASSMVWSPVPKAYFMESAFLLPSGKWVVSNELGIEEKLVFPRLAAWLYSWYANIDQGNQLLYILIWRPAVQLFAAIACALVLALRRRQWRYLMILTPLLVHSITLMLVNVAQDLRYQYPAYLIALFFFGFLFVPKVEKNQPGGHEVG